MESGRGRRIFVKQTNAPIMLNTISWLQFGLGLLTGLVLYYAFVLLSFYGKELKQFLQRRKDDPSPRTDSSVQGQPSGGDAASRQAASSSMGRAQPNLFPPEGATRDKPELFRVMEKVIALLRAVVEEGSATGITRDELLQRFRQVLSAYGHLKKTPYEVAINNYLQRTCTTHFSVMISDPDLAGLWPR
jgi:hypothetical protein